MFTKSCSSDDNMFSETVSPVTDEEAVVAAYISGFVCCKLKQQQQQQQQHNSIEDYVSIVDTIVGKLEPSHWHTA